MTLLQELLGFFLVANDETRRNVNSLIKVKQKIKHKTETEVLQHIVQTNSNLKLLEVKLAYLIILVYFLITHLLRPTWEVGDESSLREFLLYFGQ